MVPFLALLPAFSLAQATSRSDADVYIRNDDQAINKLIEDGLEREAAGRWKEAIERYERVIELHDGQLVPWGPRTYLSAAEYARMRLADLPAEGRKILENLHGSAARDALERVARHFDVETLERLSRSVPGAGCMRATRMLASYHMERGDWQVALRNLNRILRLVPEGSDRIDLDAVRARAAFCRARLGEAPFLDSLDSDLGRVYRGSVRVGGSDVPLESFLDGLDRDTPDDERWTTFGGNPAHSKVADLSATGFELCWSHRDMLEPEDVDEDARPRTSPLEQEPNPVLSPFPVIHDDTILFYNERVAACVDRETGGNRWIKQLDRFGAGSRKGRTYFYGAAGAGAYVLVHEFGPDIHETGYFEDLDSGTSRRLIALSTSDGATLWTRGGADDESVFLRDLLFTGPPILVHDRVYLAGMKLEGSDGAAKAHCTAFDLGTGKLLWHTFLCSAPRTESSRQMTAEGPFLTFGEGLLFCGTDMGILSAIDPETGSHVWCFQYERSPSRTVGKMPTYSYRERWSDNPMIVRDGRLYATPGDSHYLHVTLTRPDRESGLVRLARLDKSAYRYLIGVKDRTVFLAGRDELGTQYMISAFHPEGGARCNLWDFQIPNPLPSREGPKDSLRGRAVLSNSRIYVPTDKGIYVLNTDRGELLSHVANPDGGTLRFGNLVATGDSLIAACRLQLNCFRAKGRER